jgi:hypothetical protein
LLVDHVAEEVMETVVELGLRKVLLARLLKELIFGGLVLTPRDDLVIDASDDVLYDAAVGGDGLWRWQSWDL